MDGNADADRYLRRRNSRDKTQKQGWEQEPNFSQNFHVALQCVCGVWPKSASECSSAWRNDGQGALSMPFSLYRSRNPTWQNMFFCFMKSLAGGGFQRAAAQHSSGVLQGPGCGAKLRESGAKEKGRGIIPARTNVLSRKNYRCGLPPSGFFSGCDSARGAGLDSAFGAASACGLGAG